MRWNNIDTLSTAETYLIIGMSITLISIGFWGGRILTRLYLGQVHLANDARERTQLIKTYLALNSEDAATDQDRAIVLATIFRPSTDGVVRDDGAPAISLAGLTSAAGTRSS